MRWYDVQAKVQVTKALEVTCTGCELSGESDSLIIGICSDLVSDFRRRLTSGENRDVIFADLEYGIEAELEDFERRLRVLLLNIGEETDMVETNDNGLSTSSQPAKTPS